MVLHHYHTIILPEAKHLGSILKQGNPKPMTLQMWTSSCTAEPRHTFIGFSVILRLHPFLIAHFSAGVLLLAVIAAVHGIAALRLHRKTCRWFALYLYLWNSCPSSTSIVALAAGSHDQGLLRCLCGATWGDCTSRRCGACPRCAAKENHRCSYNFAKECQRCCNICAYLFVKHSRLMTEYDAPRTFF